MIGADHALPLGLLAHSHRGQRQRPIEPVNDAPRPLVRFPFVSSYGPLNFYLANHAGAAGGFDRSPLEEPPPLKGGAARYPEYGPATVAAVSAGHLLTGAGGLAIGALVGLPVAMLGGLSLHLLRRLNARALCRRARGTSRNPRRSPAPHR